MLRMHAQAAHTHEHHAAGHRQRAAHTTSSTWPRGSSMEGQRGNWVSIMPGEHTLMSPQEIPKKVYNAL